MDKKINKNGSKIMLSINMEALVTDSQRHKINQMMDDYNVSEAYLHMGGKDGHTYDFLFTHTNGAQEKNVFETNNSEYVYTYPKNETRNFTVELYAYPFSEKQNNPNKMHVRLTNENGELKIYMPIN